MHIPTLTMGLIAGSTRSGGSLRDSLVEWWDFENNSADTAFLGSKNAYPLNLLNSQTTATQSTASGRKGRAANWSNAGSNDAGQVPRSNTAFDFGDQGFSVGLWLQFNEMPSDDLARRIVGRYGDDSGVNANYVLSIRTLAGAQQFLFGVRNAANTAYSSALAHTTGQPLTSGAWYFTVFAHDPTADQLILYVNNVKQTQAWSQGVYSGGSANFALYNMRYNDISYYATSRTVGMKTDCLFAMNRLITDGEVNYLYAAGAGKSYADLIADGM